LGATVLYVTHDQVEAMAMADKIAVMSFGRLLQHGAPTELYRKPNCPEVADFFGAVNWLAGKLIAANFVETAIGRFEVSTRGDSGTDVVVGFRPECLEIADRNTSVAQNCFGALLRSSTFLGDQFVYEASVQDQLLVGKSRLAPARGEGQLKLFVRAADLMVFPRSEAKNELLPPQPLIRAAG